MLATKTGQLFSIFADSGFKKLIYPILRTINLLITVHIKSKIEKEIENKLICLKIYGTTWHDKSFIGINIRYILNGKVITDLLDW